MPNTTQWGAIGAIAIPIANAVASSVCGHSVDLTTISWVSEISVIAVAIGGYLTEHLNLGSGSSGTNSVPNTTTAAAPSVNALTPDG